MELARTNPMTVLIAFTIAIFGMVLVFVVAARWLRQSNDGMAARRAAVEERWRSLLEAILAGTLAEDELHQQVGSEERLELVEFLYQQVLDDEREDWRQLCRRVAGRYLDAVATTAQWGGVRQRARAVRMLAELAQAEHGSAIVTALDDPAPHVAQAAARAYARLGLGPIETLLQRMERYQPWDRLQQQQTLAAMGPTGAPALLRSVTDRSVPVPVRVVCADALAALGREGCNEAALRVLREESDLELRAAALRLFRGEVTEEQRAAVRALRESREPMLQGQAVACLARIGGRADLVEVEAALDHASPWVRFNAASGLKQRNGTRRVLAGAGVNGHE